MKNPNGNLIQGWCSPILVLVFLLLFPGFLKASSNCNEDESPLIGDILSSSSLLSQNVSCFGKEGTAHEIGGDVDDTETEIEGAPDDVGVQIWNNGDEVTIRFDGQILAGDNYTIYVRKRPGEAGIAIPDLYESTDGASFFLHPDSDQILISSSAAWVTFTLTAQIDVTTLRFGKGLFAVPDYEVDAISSDDCQPLDDLFGNGWDFDCLDDVNVDIIGVGAENDIPVNITIPNPANVTAIVVEVVYQGNNPGISINILDQGGIPYIAQRVTPPGTSTNVWYYRADMPPGTTSINYNNTTAQGNLQSVVSYIFRQGLGNNTSTNGIFESRSLYFDTYTFNLDIPVLPNTRDVVIKVPLSGITNDGLVATVIASSGGVIASQTINGSDLNLGSCCLNIVEILLPNVPGSADFVQITVESMPIGGVNPQTVILSGLVEATSACGCINIADAGDIDGDEEMCGSYDPSTITSTTDASGGVGGVIEYRWLVSVDGGSNFSVIAGAAGATYNPPTISQTSIYRRQAKRTTCTLWETASNDVTKEVVTNFVNGGSIEANESNCGPFNPALITNVSSPSGGSGGTLLYQWQSRIIGGSFTDISGANSITYDPGFISQTMQYRRRALLLPCTTWRNSNVVTKTIVDFPADVTATASGQLTCVNLFVQLFGNSSTSGVSYSWTGPGSFSSVQQNPFVVLAGTYILTVNNLGCTTTASVTVAEDTTQPGASGTGGTITCNNPDVQLNGNSPTSGVIYSWIGPNGFTSNIQNPLADQPGVYDLIVTNPANGCSSTAAIIVDENTQEPGASATGGNITCINLDVQLFGSSSTAGVLFSWSGPGGFDSGLQNPVVSVQGNYILTVTDQINGCSSTSTAFVGEDLAQPGANAFGAMITCANPNVQIAGNSPTPGVSYSWSGPGGFASTLQNPIVSLAGVYTMTVTSPANGCTSVALAVVDEDLSEPGASATGGTLSCIITSIQLTGSSPTNGVSYSWTGPNAFSSTDQNPTVFLAGNYTLTITNNSNGCTSTATAAVNEDLNFPGANASGGALTCDNPLLQLMGASPTSGVIFGWTGPNGFSSSIQNPTTSDAGTYTLIVTNPVNGCTSTDNTVVDDNTDSPGASSTGGTITCTTTQIQLMATSSTPGVSYTWAGPMGFSSTQQNPVVSVPGIYGLIIENNATGCISTSIAVVNEEVDAPGASISGSMVITCLASSVTLTGNSPTVGVTYSWTGPGGFTSSSQAISVSIAGQYNLNVENPANGCSSTASSVVVEDTETPNASGSGGTITCSNPNIQIMGNSTTSGAIYGWSGPGGFTSSDQNPMVSVPGTYVLTVTNPANGCTENIPIIVVENTTAPSVSVLPDGMLTCSNISVILNTVSSALNASFSWVGPGGFTSTDQNPLVSDPGGYSVTVTDQDNGCATIASATVSQDVTVPGANATGGLVTCAAPSVTLMGSSPTNPVFYNWTGPNGFISNIQNPVVGDQGTYTLTVTDTANGCTSTATAVVTGDSQVPGATAVGGQLTCINLTVQLMGSSLTGGVTYAWSGPGSYSSILQNPIVSVAGTYSLTVTDPGNGCTSVADAIVDEDILVPGAIAIGATLNCLNSSVNLSGSSPTPGVSFNWSGPGGFTSADPNPAVTVAGTYALTVTNFANGCISTATAEVIEDIVAPGAMALGGTITCLNPGIQLMGSSSTAGVTYSWSGPGGFASSMQNPTVIAAETYNLTVTDPTNGCTSLSSAIVDFVDDLTATIASSPVELCTSEPGIFEASDSGSGATYQWDFGADAIPSIATGPGPHTVTYFGPGIKNVILTVNQNGCVDTDQVLFEVYEAPEISNVFPTDPTCLEGGSIFISSSNGPQGFEFNIGDGTGWHPEQNVFTGLPAGTYNISVRRLDGRCEISVPAIVLSSPLLPTIQSITVIPESACDAEDGIMEVTLDSPGMPPYFHTYELDGNVFVGGIFLASPITLNGLPHGTYSQINIVDQNGCEAVDNGPYVIDEFGCCPDAVIASAAPNPACTNEMVTFVAVDQGPGATYSWNYGPDATPVDPINQVSSASWSTPGTKTITLSVTLNNCTELTTTTVEISAPVPQIEPIPETCAGESVLISAVSIGPGAIYEWDFGPDATPSTSILISQTVIYGSPGAKTVTLTVTDSDGCSASTQAVAVVNSEVFADGGHDRTICGGESTQLGGLSGSGPPGATYLWVPSEGLNDSTVAAPIATPGDTTTYTLFVTFGACVTSSDVIVNVDVSSVPFAFAGPDQSSCSGDPVTLGGDGLNPTGPDGSIYSWASTPGDPTLTEPTLENPVVNPVITTDYTVTVSKNGCTMEDDVTVNVLSLTPADAGAGGALCVGDPNGILIGTSNIPFFSYSWSPTTGLQISPGAGGLAIATPTITTIYTLTQTDANGCISTDQVTVVAFDCNDPPIAINDINNTLEGTPVNGFVLTNDFDVNGDNLLVTLVNATPVGGGTTIPTANGSVTIFPDGSYSYTPNPGFTGTEVFSYQVCDDGEPGPKCDEAFVTIEIRENSSGNNLPIANDDVVLAQESNPVTSNLLNNDGDPDGDILILNTTPIIDPLNGTVTILLNGSYTYTPNLEFIGIDNFTYEVCDAGGLCDQALVTIVVLPGEVAGNNPPIAVDDNNSTQESTPVSGSVIPNDSDPDSDPLSVDPNPVTDPSNGMTILNTDGSYSYSPNPGFTGTDSFVYEVCDGQGGCDQATLTINVYNLNNLPPIANNDFGSTTPGLAVDIDLTLNDYDPDGDPLEYTLTPVSGPSNGTVIINPDGTIRYTPDVLFLGIDQFEYEICDNTSGCDLATVTIEVFGNTSQNDPPIATNDANSTSPNMAVSGNVVDNDNDPESDPLTVTAILVDNPDNGNALIDPAGNYTYTPNPGFSGTDTFQYEVCDGISGCDIGTVTIIVIPPVSANDPPVAVADHNSTQESTPVSGNILDNDYDPNGDLITINTTLINAPDNGTVTQNPDGSYTYIPDPGFTGNDTFVYEICDDQGACDQATVTITVYSLPFIPPSNIPPFAGDDAAATFVDIPVSGIMDSNDIDPEGLPLTYNLTPVDNVDNGSVVINVGGTFTYIPDPGYLGPDQFIYEVCDAGGECVEATVYITVYPRNDPPVAINDINNTLVDTPVSGNVLTNDFDPNGDNILVATANGIVIPAVGTLINTSNGTLTIFPDGTYLYTPTAGFEGEDSFVYEICDDGVPGPLCTTATVTIEVFSPTSPVNNPPIANDDHSQTEQNMPVIIQVLSNDYDPDGDVLNAPTQIGFPANGIVISNPDGTYTYVPNPGFTGEDGFNYEICDPSGFCDNAWVTILVSPGSGMANNPPVGVDDAYYTQIDTPIGGFAADNDYDPDGDSPLTFVQTSVSLNGSVAFNSDGTFVYTPDPGYTGPDNYTYEVCDGISGCDAATVYITVGPRNDPPVAINDINNTLVDVPVDGNVLTNDYDPDGDIIAVTQVNGSVVSPGGTTVATPNGTVSFLPNGDYTYTPAPGFAGEDIFDYEICDDGVPGPLCITATATIVVLSPDDPDNNPPVAVNDATQTEENTPVTVNVISNDYDPDADLLGSPIQTSSPLNGSATQNPDGTFTYTPNPGYTGDDSFTYEVCDQAGLCDDATVTIVITTDNGESNDPPVALDDIEFTPFNTPVLGDASLNDSDPDGDSPLTFSQTSSVSNGSVIFNSDGSFNYLPNIDFTGPDQFTYEVCDGISGCDYATIYLVVGPRNDPPVAIDDVNNTLVDLAVSGTVITNDYDPNGDNITTTEVNGSSIIAGGTTVSTLNGSVSIFPDGSYIYTPDPGFVGEDVFIYIICDDGVPGPLCTDGTVTIEIIAPANPVNNLPIANDDATQTEEDTPVIINVLPNDYDPDGDLLSIPVQTSLALNGVVVQNPDGTFTYTPNPGFTGEDSFIYETCDPGGLCDLATVTIVVIPDNGEPNDPPIAVDDVNYMPFNTPVSSDASENDYDPDGDSPLLFIQTSSPSNGMVVFNPNGTFTYFPDPGYTGQDNFTYQVCDGISGCDNATVYLVVGPNNDPPVAVNDDNNTTEGTSVSGALLPNDYDPNGDNIIFSGIEVLAAPGTYMIAPVFLPGVDDAGNPVPLAGFLIPTPDGSYTFNPAAGFTGQVQANYQICDDGTLGPFCDVGVLTIIVSPSFIQGNRPPIANDDDYVTEIDTPVSSTVISNDSDPDGDPLTITGFDDGLGGYASSVSELEGTFTFNSPGLPDNGDYTFTPTPGFTGTVGINYEICDLSGSGICTIARLTIEIISGNGPENDPPFAGDDFSTTFKNETVIGNWFDNDGDPNSDVLIANGFGLPIDPGGPPITVGVFPTSQGGFIQLLNNGNYFYSPPSGYIGPDHLQYQICESISPELYCADATIYLLVLERISLPVAINDFNNTIQDVDVDGNVLTNDYDSDGDPLTVSGFHLTPGGGGPYVPFVTIPGQGLFTLNDPVSGDYTFDPDPGFLGTTNPVEYQVCDPGGSCAEAYVVIEVIPGDSPANDPPVANDDHYQTPFMTPANGSILPNDLDPDGDPFTLTGGDDTGFSTNGGTWALNSDGTFTYVPPIGFSGLDIMFVYEICDGLSGCDQALVTVLVGPDDGDPNFPPIAVDDAFITDFNTMISGNDITDNDPDDPDGDLVTITLIDGNAVLPGGTTVNTINGGSSTLFPDGSFSYTPALDFSGPDRFVYQVCDGVSGCDQATVYITVLPEICIDIQLAVFLEGSYLPGQNMMRTELNTSRMILPGQTPANPLITPTSPGNPYDTIPWSYTGTFLEQTFTGPYENANGEFVTDWLLISFRTSPSSNDFMQANGLLYADGHVEFIQECVLRSTDPDEVWVVIEHRNHMGVMTDTAVTVQDGVLIYDFRQTDSYKLPTSFGQKQLEPGVFAMYSGDAQQIDMPSYDITGLDNILWTIDNGNFDQYLSTDFDMDGDVTGADIIIWSINNGISSAVPKN